MSERSVSAPDLCR